jgi:hypothetical protein
MDINQVIQNHITVLKCHNEAYKQQINDAILLKESFVEGNWDADIKQYEDAIANNKVIIEKLSS